MKPVMQIVLAVLGLSGALAEDFSLTKNGEPIPVRMAEPVSDNRLVIEDSTFQLVIDPTRVTGNYLTSTQSSEQKFGIGYRYPLAGSWELGHDSRAGFSRTDPLAGEQGDPAASQTFSMSQRGFVRWTGPGKLGFTASSGSGNAIRNDQAGADHFTNQGVQVTWKLSAATAARAEGGFNRKFGMDQSIVNQDIYSAVLDHKIDPVPVTLNLSQSFVQERNDTAPETGKDQIRFATSAKWTVEPGAVLSLGMTANQSDFTQSVTEESGTGYFSELKLQPATAFGIRMRAAYENASTRPAAFSEPDINTDTLSLNLGFSLKVTEGFDAGMGFLYRLEDRNEMGFDAASPYLTLSGSASF